MPAYEVYCIAKANASAEHLSTLLKKVATVLKPRSGVIRKVDNYGLKPLAYRIRAHSRYHHVGRYFMFKMQASPASLPEVLHRLKVDEGIIRIMANKVTLQDSVKTPTPAPYTTIPAPLGEVHYDALRRTTNIDYYIARTLLEVGKITPAEIKALGTHTPLIEPMQHLYETDRALESVANADALNVFAVRSSDELKLVDELEKVREQVEETAISPEARAAMIRSSPRYLTEADAEAAEAKKKIDEYMRKQLLGLRYDVDQQYAQWTHLMLHSSRVDRELLRQMQLATSEDEFYRVRNLLLIKRGDSETRGYFKLQARAAAEGKKELVSPQNVLSQEDIRYAEKLGMHEKVEGHLAARRATVNTFPVVEPSTKTSV